MSYTANTKQTTEYLAEIKISDTVLTRAAECYNAGAKPAAVLLFHEIYKGLPLQTAKFLVEGKAYAMKKEGEEGK